MRKVYYYATNVEVKPRGKLVQEREGERIVDDIELVVKPDLVNRRLENTASNDPPFPWIFYPVIQSGIGRYIHVTFTIVVEPGTTSLPLMLLTPVGWVYRVFGITYGRVRDYETYNPIVSNLTYISMAHSKMMLSHDDPAMESLYGDTPHIMDISRLPEETFYMNFVNKHTAFNILWDLTLHCLAFEERHKQIIDLYTLTLDPAVLILYNRGYRPKEIMEGIVSRAIERYGVVK